MIRGIDVSAVQGAIDWGRVAASGVAFVIVKVTEGTWQDPSALTNLAGARSAGLPASLYHFARISLGDPEPQVDALWAKSGDTMPDFPPALDLESAPNGMRPDAVVAWAERWISKCHDTFGRSPLLYTYPDFERRWLGVAAAKSLLIATCPLWMADYSGGELPRPGWRPFVPAPWVDWTIAQTSGNASSFVPGIVGHVDHNVFNGNETDFARFRGIPDPPDTVPDIPSFCSPEDDEP